MGNVNASDIWTPDESDNLDPEVWSSAMADSIHNGIGVRLNRQEQAIGLKAIIPPGTTLGPTATIAPYQITNSEISFTQGLELNGGIATVSVAGMYLIAASASLNSVELTAANLNRTIAVQLMKNSTQLAGAEVTADQKYWQTAAATCVINCIPGDTLWVQWYSAPQGSPANAAVSDNGFLNTLSIVLITPIAV